MDKFMTIHPDGTYTVQPLADRDSGDRLAQLKEAVGGWIEGVYNGDDMVMYCNEEGKLQGMVVNVAAQMIWEAALGGHPGDFLVGPVAILGPTDDEGYESGLSDEVMTEIITGTYLTPSAE